MQSTITVAQLIELAQRGWPTVASQIRAARPITSGLSGDPLWQLTTAQGTFALRGWPLERAETLRLAQGMLSHIDQRCPNWVPRPLPCYNSEGAPKANASAVAGHLWELAPWLSGEADFDKQPSPSRLAAACTALAEFHQLAAGYLPDVPLRESSVQHHLRQLARMGRHLAAGLYRAAEHRAGTMDWPTGWPGIEVALAQAGRRATEFLRPLARQPFSQQVCWGDAWPANVLFGGEIVTGLTDFAAVRVDTPAADLARMLGAATADCPAWWTVGMEAYQALLPLTPLERQAVAALAISGGVISLANWVRWLLVEQREFAQPDAAVRRLGHFAQRVLRHV